MEKVNPGSIGVFDSGYGGISVLANLIEAMPGESFVFLSDSKHAPYGELAPGRVLEHTMHSLEYLKDLSVDAVVIACNTATSAAVEVLRETFAFPIIGMEPAVKPAVKKGASSRILVAATALTLKESKFAALMESIGDQHEIVRLPCHGLVDQIEKYGPESTEVDKKIEELLEPYKSFQFDGVVLGCTHYVLIKNQWQKKFPKDTVIYDGNEGTVRQTIRMLKKQSRSISFQGPAKVCLMDSSQSIERLIKSKNLLLKQLQNNGEIALEQLQIELRKTNELCEFGKHNPSIWHTANSK